MTTTEQHIQDAVAESDRAEKIASGEIELTAAEIVALATTH